MKPLLIGHSPGAQGNGEPLSGRCGRRLASLCGLTLDEYLAAFERVNLLPDPDTPLADARSLAQRFRSQPAGRTIVVLGLSTAAYFGLTGPAFVFSHHCGCRYAFTPHPSGRNRWWNEPENVRRAERFWTAVVRAVG